MTFRTFVSSRVAAAVLLCSLPVLIAGCSGSFESVSDPSPVTGALIKGAAYGGQQAIVGATVQLWAVGSGSYGATATALGSAVTTGAGGAFTLGTYVCPTTATQVYITSKGGNPGYDPTNNPNSVNNPNIVLAAALGSCGTLLTNKATTFITINEVTTAATAFALGQYFTTTFGASSTDSFGAPATTQAQLGIANAFSTAASLVNTTTGNAVTSSTLTANGFTIAVTPESAKLYTIANILAACVNTSGVAAANSTNCSTLFADVVPSGATAPTDTLQAAVYMSLNPTSTNGNGSAANLTALYTLPPATAPFAGLTAQPTDWTLGILYTDTTSGTPVLSAPQNIAVDASGNIWVASDNSGANGGLGELSPVGSPLVGTSFASATNGPITALNPRNVAIDLTGDVWLTTSSSSGVVFEYIPSTTTVNSIKLGKDSYGLAVDSSNDVFVGEESSSDSSEGTAPLGPNSIYEFPLANINSLIEYPVSSLSSALRPEYLAFDTSGNLWANDGGDQTTVVYQISGITPCAPTTVSGSVTYCTVTQTSTQNAYNVISQGSPDAPYGVAAGSGGIWYANRTGNNLTFLSLTGATVNSGTAYGSSTTISAPKFIAVDGAGNVWTAANNETSPGAVSEVSSAGTVLSPSNAGTMPFNVLGYSHVGITTGAGIAVDPSGNVWVADDLPAGNTSGASVFELVGAGAPTVTPLAAQLPSSVAKKP